MQGLPSCADTTILLPMSFCAVNFQNSKFSQVVQLDPDGDSQQQVQIPKLLLRCGDRARVRFRFMHYAEFIEPGALFVFREGRSKGLGRVKQVYCGT